MADGACARSDVQMAGCERAMRGKWPFGASVTACGMVETGVAFIVALIVDKARRTVRGTHAACPCILTDHSSNRTLSRTTSNRKIRRGPKEELMVT